MTFIRRSCKFPSQQQLPPGVAAWSLWVCSSRTVVANAETWIVTTNKWGGKRCQTHYKVTGCLHLFSLSFARPWGSGGGCRATLDKLSSWQGHMWGLGTSLNPEAHSRQAKQPPPPPFDLFYLIFEISANQHFISSGKIFTQPVAPIMCACSPAKVLECLRHNPNSPLK